jgi:hypothetical protein
MTIRQLELKYGIKVEDDSYYHPLLGRYVKQYKMYSADGCRWETGLPTVKAIENECKQWENVLINIKERVIHGLV